MRRKFAALLTAAVMTLSCAPAAAAASYTYYSNDMDAGRLYRMSESGSINRLSMYPAENIAVLGSWVYYYDSSVIGGVFRTKTDGSVTEKLLSADSTGYYSIFKDNGHIYVSHIDGLSSEGAPTMKHRLVNIYDSKGFIDTVIIDGSGDPALLAECVAVEDNELFYLSENDFGLKQYYKMYISYKGRKLEYRPVSEAVSSLPLSVSKKAVGRPADVPADRYCRSKYLKWKAVKGAEKYIVYVLDEPSGKYRRLAEVKDTEVTVTVPDSDYNGSYRVTAVKGGKNYKASLISTDSSAGNLPGNLSNSPFTVSDEKLTYVCMKDGIYSYDLTYSLNKRIYKGENTGDLYLYGGKLYFNDKLNIYSMNTDGSGLKVIDIKSTLPYKLDFDISCMTVYDGGIVFCARQSNTEAVHTSIIRVNTDGSGGKLLSSGSARQIVPIEGRFIYMSRDGRLYSIDLSGNEYPVTKDAVNGFSVYEGSIYYTNDDGIFRVNSDGSRKTRIYDHAADSVNIYDGVIYYEEIRSVESNRVTRSNICSVVTDGSDERTIFPVPAPNANNILNVSGDKIYYKDKNGKVYCCSLKTNDMKEMK